MGMEDAVAAGQAAGRSEGEGVLLCVFLPVASELLELRVRPYFRNLVRVTSIFLWIAAVGASAQLVKSEFLTRSDSDTLQFTLNAQLCTCAPGGGGGAESLQGQHSFRLRHMHQ